MSKRLGLVLVALLAVGIGAAVALTKSARTSSAYEEPPLDSSVIPADASGDTPG